MPKFKMSNKEFEALYKEVSSKTNNFKKISSETISQNPHYIKVFRMLCGKSLIEIAKEFRKTHATIAQYERKAIKRIPIIEAEKIATYLKEELPSEISMELAFTNLKKFRDMSHGGYVQAFKRAEKAELTAQEKTIKTLLEKNGIKYEVHKTMETSIGPLNFDFWDPRSKTVIECTESVSKHKAECLGFRILKLKDKIKCNSIVVVPKNVSNGVIRRLQDYDHIIFSSDISKLENIIK